jgi:hypothetical protein
MRHRSLFLLAALAAAPLVVPAVAPEAAEEPLRIVLRDHQFVPDRVDVPAKVKIRILIKNESDKTIEWESDELDREEVIEPGEERAVFLGPLEPGSYPFYDDRHSATKGVLIAR